VIAGASLLGDGTRVRVVNGGDDGSAPETPRQAEPSPGEGR
jgi:hypothetical protein